MPIQLSNQLERLSYTRRDLELTDEEVNRFISHFIPVIKNTGKANVGRLYLRVIEAILDKGNYAVDMRFRQSVLRTVSELQSAIDIAEFNRYKPAGTAAATSDLTITSLIGVAPAGGIAIAQYSIFLTETSPTRQFLTLVASSIPEGASSVSGVSAVEGSRVVGQTLLASALGEPNEEVRFPVAKTPHEYIEIQVDGVDYSIRSDLKDSEPEDRHVYLRDDEDRYTTVIFGDGEYGLKLSSGAAVTATYIQCSGEGGNTPANVITRVVGSLSSQVSVTNPEAAAGGFDGDEVEDIVRKAPLLASAARGAATDGADFFLAGDADDAAALAEVLVPGVFRALGDDGTGPVLNLYVMPAGGGVASSALLTNVADTLEPRLIHGVTLNVGSLLSAHVLLRMNVSLLVNKVSKSVARRKVYEAIAAFKLDGTVNSNGALYYRNLTIGRGFTLSDLASLIEAIDDGTLVDYVDFNTVTRYPTPIAQNGATLVEFNGEIVPLSPTDYDSWSVVSTSTTTFALMKNGVVDSYGTIGVTHTSSDGSIQFTLGETTDVFVPSVDVWTFNTSAYRNNMRLDKFEAMELARDSDLQISIHYPGELTIGS